MTTWLGLVATTRRRRTLRQRAMNELKPRGALLTQI
jgi:hypothetical protein